RGRQQHADRPRRRGGTGLMTVGQAPGALPPANALLLVEEAAARLRISTSAVRRLVRDGHLPHVRPTPRRVCIPAEAVEAHIRRNTTAGHAGADLGGLKWVKPPRPPSSPPRP